MSWCDGAGLGVAGDGAGLCVTCDGAGLGVTGDVVMCDR